MVGDTYIKLFLEQLVPNVLLETVVVIDNVPYNTHKVEKIPINMTKKEDITTCLTGNKNVAFHRTA